MINKCVTEFVEDALKHASDNYRQPASPLLADAYNKETKQHLRRDYGKKLECADVVFSNLARQMNFMRVLNALYVLEGNENYQKVFVDNYNYYIENYQHENGLFAWGGHRMIDLKTLETTGEMTHELKNDYPAYSLMLSINREKTLKYIEAFWNAHVYKWETLETSRHGDYEKKMGRLWDNEFADPEPFIEVTGLSFANTGSDLIYAACEYYKATGEEKALLWAKRLEHMYYKSRDKETGLGVYQFNQTKARKFSDDFSITTSDYGDRAKRQMGPELGETCLEGNLLLDSKTKTIYCFSTLVLLHEARTLSTFGGFAAELAKTFLDHCREGLESFAKHAYIPETNKFRPLLANGHDLTNFELQRDGYYGKKGNIFKQYSAEGTYFLVFSKTAAMTGSDILWQTAKQIGQALGLGCIGEKNGAEPSLNYESTSDCHFCLFAFLNLYLITKNDKYLNMADIIVKNISTKYRTFINSKSNQQEYISINNILALAITCYEATKLGKLNEIDASIYI